jgi:Trypsin-like peptidase domain
MRAPLCVLAVLAASSHGAVAGPAVQVYAANAFRTAHVEIIGTLYNDTQEVGAGSGVLLGDRFVLTNKHVIPSEQNYKKLMVLVRLGSRQASPTSAVAVTRDPDHDLALIELASGGAEGAAVGCPLRVAVASDSVPVGSTIFALGFPLNQELSIVHGIVSNKTDPNGRWQTDTLINKGNSGGPFFDEYGRLVGVAVGGIVSWRVGDKVVDVDGVNYLLPIQQFIGGPLYARLASLPTDPRCWVEQNTLLDGSLVVSPASVERAPSDPDIFRQTFAVAQTKDDHPVIFEKHSRKYEQVFRAEPGYLIDSCSFDSTSANHAKELTCNVVEGGTKAQFSYVLTSGPAYDRWRGWLLGTFTLVQSRQD